MSRPSGEAVLSPDGYFEDFPVGRRLRHARSTTLHEVEGSFLAKLVMNTAQAHWNEHLPEVPGLGAGRVVYGLLTASAVFGLASQDVAEHAVREISCTGLRFRASMHHGDTVTAYTEVLATHPDRAEGNATPVTFRHWGLRQDDVVVFQGDRTVLLRHRPTDPTDPTDPTVGEDHHE